MQKARLLRLKNRIPGEGPVEVYAQCEFAGPQTLILTTTWCALAVSPTAATQPIPLPALPFARSAMFEWAF